MPRVLIIDDDQELAQLLSELLAGHDFESEIAKDAASAREKLKRRTVDLIVLDVRMPGESGMDLCREIRSQSATPIIMLTGADELVDRVVGLELGADDYVTKPFEGRELLARIRSVLRRSGDAGAPGSELNFGDWRLDLRRCELRRASVLVPLSTMEFHILRALAQRPNVTMSREWLAEAAFRSSHEVQSRRVDVLVSRLRSKLSAHGAGDLIETVRTSGYVLRWPA